jgi:hypothetical protein
VLGVPGAADVEWYLAAADVLFSVAWWFLLRSYRDLNPAEFRVILDLEKLMPARIYADEWAPAGGNHRAPRSPVRQLALGWRALATST